MQDPQSRETPSERNIGAIVQLERAALRERSAATRFSDAVTRMTGSAEFAIAHVVWFSGWVLANTVPGIGIRPFDPFPFGLLTLAVSLEAIFLTVFVLMSQNRMTHQADQRARLDLQIDLLAEEELTMILHMLRALCAKHQVHVDISDERLRQALEDTDVQKLATTLDQRLPGQ